jgi:ABC-type branched-subunit amino acid transport system permease subunit
MVTSEIMFMLIGAYVLVYHLMYKSNTLLGNLFFIFLSVTTLAFTSGDEIIVSYITIMLTVIKFILDVMNFQKE